jgi:hypothetical protein
MLREGWEALLNWVYMSLFVLAEEIWFQKTDHIYVKPQLKEPAVGKGRVYRTYVYVCFSQVFCPIQVFSSKICMNCPL